MTDTERLDFVLLNNVEIIKNPMGEWVCFIDDAIVGRAGTAREAIDEAIGKQASWRLI